MKYLTKTPTRQSCFAISNVAFCLFVLLFVSNQTWAQTEIRSNSPVRPQFEESNLPQLDSPDQEDEKQQEDDQETGIDQISSSAVPQWPSKTIREIRVDVRDSGNRVPEDRSTELGGFGGPSIRPTTGKVFAWAAPNIRYQPLYFEDVPLERYGQTLPPFRQSALSTVHFFKSFVLIPHQMRHDHPGSCDYPLGFCRPGNVVSYVMERKYFGRVR